MPSERELRILQEDKLFDIVLIMKLLNIGKDIDTYLATMYAKAQSGMTADEIDAVKERATQVIEKYSK